MLDLLKSDYYYLNIKVKQENLALYKKRIEIYLNRNTFARHAFKHFNYSKRPTRVIASIANFLSQQNNIKNYLQEAIDEYTKVINGHQILILQKPYLTPENFPSLVQHGQPKPETINKMPDRIDCIFDGVLAPVSYYRDSSEADQKQAEILLQEETQSYDKAIKDAEQPGEKGSSFGIVDSAKIIGELSLLSIISDIKIKDIFNLVYMVKNTIFLSKKHFRPFFLASLLSICALLSGDQPVSPNKASSDFTVETKVRTGWNNGTSLKVGDIVEFQINYKNTSDQTQNDVLVDSDLPANLKYVAGTTRLYNGKYTSGMSVESDAVTLNGLNIGNYTAGANALVRFKAEVVDETFTCGLFTLRNWGRVSVGSKVIQDSADVNVQLAHCPDVKNDIEA